MSRIVLEMLNEWIHFIDICCVFILSHTLHWTLTIKVYFEYLVWILLNMVHAMWWYLRKRAIRVHGMHYQSFWSDKIISISRLRLQQVKGIWVITGQAPQFMSKESLAWGVELELKNGIYQINLPLKHLFCVQLSTNHCGNLEVHIKTSGTLFEKMNYWRIPGHNTVLNTPICSKITQSQGKASWEPQISSQAVKSDLTWKGSLGEMLLLLSHFSRVWLCVTP